MADGVFGKVTARGSTAFVKLVQQALGECVNVVDPPLQDRLPVPYVIEEHTPDEFRARGFVFADGTVNEGRVVKVGLLWINSRIVRFKPRRARHIVRHEISHILPLSATKKGELLKLMWRKDGSHPRRWSAKSYDAQPEECHADTLAEAMSGIDSPWDDFVFYRVDVNELDLPKFVDITFRVDPPPPIPEPPEPPIPPDPLPPVDPVVAELQARLEAIEKIAAGELEGLMTVEARPVDRLWIGRRDAIAAHICFRCQEKVYWFADDVSRIEYTISGLCQKCQDFAFRELPE